MWIVVTTPNRLLQMQSKNRVEQKSTFLLLKVKHIQVEEGCRVVLLACQHLYTSVGVQQTVGNRIGRHYS